MGGSALRPDLTVAEAIVKVRPRLCSGHGIELAALNFLAERKNRVFTAARLPLQPWIWSVYYELGLGQTSPPGRRCTPWGMPTLNSTITTCLPISQAKLCLERYSRGIAAAHPIYRFSIYWKDKRA